MKDKKNQEKPANEFLGLTSEQAFHKIFSGAIEDMGNAILELLLVSQQRSHEEGGQCKLSQGKCPIFND